MDDDQTRREGPVRDPATRVEGVNPTVAAAYLARGALVGRYVVLDVLGTGGMGVVYGAFDPELDRKVAIKLLQPNDAGPASGNGSSDPRAWLVREAQALARLSHPNVVAVHDVGTLEDGQIFIAMELVEGVTLREWLKTPRSWREIIAILVAAGEGLAAAHDAGLVHRDMKPDNILVATNGRARVMDFGLARPQTTADDEAARTSDLAIETRSPLNQQLTQAGAVVGTPAYMAPEIYRGHAADARSDQFAFAVTAFEALYRARPYKKADLAPPAKPSPPASVTRGDVPMAVQRVIDRALAWERDDRYPDVHAMLGDLARVTATKKTSRVVTVALVGAAVVAGGGAFAMHRADRSDLCTGAAKRLAGVWDDGAKAKIQTAFLATKKPFAPPAFAGVSHVLDRYTQQWSTAVTESCQATHHGEQTAEVMSLRQACFDNRLEEVRVLTGLLGNADAAMVEKGDKIPLQLTPLTDCSNVAKLLEPSKPTSAQQARVTELRKKLVEAKADMAAGQYVASLVASGAAADGAKQIGYEPIVAEARIVHGATLLTSGNFIDASNDFREAVWTAIHSKVDSLAASADLSMALVTTDAGGKPAEAAIWLGHAEAMASRLGVDRDFERRELEIGGLIAAESGDLPTAIGKHEKALMVASAMFEDNAPELLTDEMNLATTYSRAGAYAKAAPHLEKSIKLRAASVGLEHPDIALIESDLGAAYTHMGEADKARAAFEASLAIREKFYGAQSPLLVAPLDNFGELLRKQGDIEAALKYQERAIPLCKKVPGEAHPMYHQLLTDYVDTLIAAKKFSEAHAWLDQAFELERENRSPTLPATQTTAAELALAENDPGKAATLAIDAIKNYEKASGEQNPALWRPLTALARAQIATNHGAEAKTSLQRAMTIGKAASISADDLAPTEKLLATL
ncbi:MAG: serine/threonine-protein kinase [Kofleriaceae bacterium]